MPDVPPVSMNDTHQDHDDLWTLLGKSRPAKASAAFSRNVVRRVRMEEQGAEPGFFEWLRSGWNWLSVAGTATAVAMVFFATQSGLEDAPQIAATDNATIDEVVRSADFAVIANLDVLMAMDDNDVWLEASLR